MINQRIVNGGSVMRINHKSWSRTGHQIFIQERAGQGYLIVLKECRGEFTSDELLNMNVNAT